MKLKTVIVGSGSKGGSGKTFSLVILAHSLKSMGYKIHLIDADSSNQTLSKVFRKELESGELKKIKLDKEGAFQKAIEACAKVDDDVITIIDMPGSKNEFFIEFFGNKNCNDFKKVGIRLIFAVTVSNSAPALQGIRDILRICTNPYPAIALKSNMSNIKGGSFNLSDSNTGQVLVSHAHGRVIEIEKLSELQRQEYDRFPAAPNEFEIGGVAASKLNLTHLSIIEWVSYSKKAVEHVFPFAEWLTDAPIPKPPKVAIIHADPSLKKLIEAMDEDDL